MRVKHILRLGSAALALLLCALLLGASRFVGTDISAPLGLSVALGEAYPFPGAVHLVTGINKFGRQSDVDTADVPADVYDCGVVGGPQTYQFSASGETHYISTSNAANTEAFTIEGLDENWLEKSETVTLQGVTTVALGGQWVRINRAYTAGASDITGNVFIHVDSDAGADGIPDAAGDFRSCIQGPFNQTLQAIYSVPADKTGYASQLCLGVNSTGTPTEVALFTVAIRRFGEAFRTGAVHGLMSTGAGSECWVFPVPVLVPSKSDVRVRALSVASNDSDVFASFDLLLWPND